MSALAVPEIAHDADALTAAIAYAHAGWYVVPVKAGTKHPGSVLGSSWQQQSSRDVAELVSWFAGTDHGLALHVGRSGAVVLDVDHPDDLPDVLGQAFGHSPPPMQTTRTGDPRRGHYLYAAPDGRTIGNGTGRLGKTWGDVRGLNGVIVVAPSQHPSATQGGRYAWAQTGTLPVLPVTIADALEDASPAQDAATDAQVQGFVDEHTTSTRSGALRAVLARLDRELFAGSRHAATLSALCWVARGARAGFYPARDAFAQVQAKFEGAKPAAERTPGEWGGMVAWAVSQALADDVDARQQAVDDRLSAPDDLAGLIAPEQLVDLPPDPGEAPAPLDEESEGNEVDRLWPVLDWADLWTTTPADVDWLCEPLLERGRSAVVYSPPKAGKSLLSLEIAAALSAGRAVLGNPTRTPMTVLYVDLENTGADIRERLDALGYGPADLERLRYLSFPSMAALDTPAGGAQLTRLVDHHQAELVVIDTVSRVVAGEENSADTYANLYRHALVPLKGRGVTVLRLDHAGKDAERGQRGSSAKSADVDHVWRLVDHDHGRVGLRREASRTGHGADHLNLQRHTEPLRHLPAGTILLDPRVEHAITVLDQAGHPADLGRDTARDALAALGVKLRATVLAEVVRTRKARSGLFGTGATRQDGPRTTQDCSHDESLDGIVAGQTCSEQDGNSGNTTSPSTGAVLFPCSPPYRGNTEQRPAPVRNDPATSHGGDAPASHARSSA